MAAEIERIVDRKTIRGRVHYLVVWRGFSEENNTWESRMDLVADGYSNVIREYENGRKDEDGSSSSGRSPSRGRSPGRSKSPGRRGRSRSNSTARSSSASRSRRRSTSRGRAAEQGETTPSRRRSARQQEKLGVRADSEAPEKKADEELLRSALAALDQSTKATVSVETPRETRRSSPRRAHARKDGPALELAYEAKKEAQPTAASAPVAETTKTVTTGAVEEEEELVKTAQADEQNVSALADLWTKINEGNWLMWFVSSVVVIASLLASRLLPGGESDAATDRAAGVLFDGSDSGAWRMWIPFLTQVIALLLVFHQRDARSSVKWIAISFGWRCAAEVLFLVGSEEYWQSALLAVAIAHVALVLTLVSIVRNREHARSMLSLLTFIVAAGALALSDWWVFESKNPMRATRVQLMSLSALAVAFSPVLTNAPSDDE
ncbi:hypothetical protein PINS_up001955 [Pythium insidiosum]|nr:hypothetical protein PINS_up001955 [Pythium insidiosum]